MNFTPTELEGYRDFAGQLADAAAQAIMPYFRKPMAIDNKKSQAFDPVTDADRAAERAMRELIELHFPAHGILGEEEENKAGSSPLTWVLDPIDGTRAFITGYPLWGTLIALNDGDYPVVGVMNQPFTGERFVGSPDGAFVVTGQEKTRLATSGCQQLAEARITCTTLDMFTDEERAAYLRVAAQARLSRYGGDCYAYCMLASGHIDAVIESDLKPYDIQALIPLIEAAGGIITNWQGESAANGGAVIAAASKELHAAILPILKE
ncbi:histidinol-phosphatase [Pokkaliibacter sp. CJK22405]|uniref:histidinol-phosphatase n=1 Tax=Pokkaliibacter sp. CJK22405 TaxID=3384615 RepID=UPI00398479CD